MVSTRSGRFIFEQVPDDEPVTWCSPLVIQSKARFAKTPQGGIGPTYYQSKCRPPSSQQIDGTKPSNPTPIVEDFIHRFHDCSICTKMDLRQGYHRLALDPGSRAVATFATPWGNYPPKRLVFGAKAAQDLLDETMQRIFGDIPRCLINQRDNLLIGARNWSEHNATLEDVFAESRRLWNHIKQNQVWVWPARVVVLWLSVQSTRTNTHT
jgi:hypothetical protein